MQQLQGKVAVITGAASGIGLALARRAADYGMRLALADIEAETLESVGNELQDSGAEVLCQVLDVRDGEAVKTFAERVKQRFGAVYLLANNAGVGGGGPIWETSEQDWQWVLGVNLWGVIHGLRAFVPDMVARNEGHIVNTASIAGLMSAPGTGTYTVSKHAVVALSEVLAGDLRNAGADLIGVSVLCPSFVATQIYACDRNRPDKAQMSPQQREEQAQMEAMAAGFFQTAMPAEDCAELVFSAMRDRRFYVLTHPEGSRIQVDKRLRAILEDGYPDVKGPEDFPLA